VLESMVMGCMFLGNLRIKSTTSSVKVPLSAHSCFIYSNSLLVGSSPVYKSQKRPSGSGSPSLLVLGKNSFN